MRGGGEQKLFNAFCKIAVLVDASVCFIFYPVCNFAFMIPGFGLVSCSLLIKIIRIPVLFTEKQKMSTHISKLHFSRLPKRLNKPGE